MLPIVLLFFFRVKRLRRVKKLVWYKLLSARSRMGLPSASTGVFIPSPAEATGLLSFTTLLQGQQRVPQTAGNMC